MALPIMQSSQPVEDESTARYDYEELLIDGDLLVFSSCAAVEYGKDVQEFTLQEILTNIEGRIQAMKRRVKARKVRIFFTADDNFRYKIMDEYKANRVGAWLPSSLKDAKSHITVMYNGEMAPGLEADDLLAVNQKTDGSTIIATIDKDIPQVRGHHYRWETQHKGEKIFVVEGYGSLTKTIHNKKTKIEGNGTRFFCYQLLIGDPTDGIMGCGKLVDSVYKTGAKAGESYTKREGVGPVGAFDLLEHAITYQRCMEIVIAQYQHCFGDKWEEMLVKNGRCLFMVNKVNEQGQFQLWHFRPSELVNSWYDPRIASVVSLKG